MRKLLLGLFTVALLALGASLPFVLPRDCPVNQAACDRIKPGMTQATVYAILGGPPGDYRTRPGEEDLSDLDLTDRGSNCESDDWPRERWLGDQGFVRVIFTPAGDVHEACFSELVDPKPVALDTAFRWCLERLTGRFLP
jgi:hypothetical protein